jgi:hypothetical protein
MQTALMTREREGKRLAINHGKGVVNMWEGERGLMMMGVRTREGKQPAVALFTQGKEVRDDELMPDCILAEVCCPLSCISRGRVRSTQREKALKQSRHLLHPIVVFD